ncbi:class IV adenylate cyclase [Streptomyces sp. AN091965]|uniref:class IV adenylate cyclase n=1 Tax=Streptomyces sp. AN091965 TaxID=2927803 RepID=UPI0035A8F306
MIEAELKARVRMPEAVLGELNKRAPARIEVYQDTYYDRPNGALEAAGQELRVRTVRGPESTRTILTFKGTSVDEASGSKPEHETLVESVEAAHAILRGLGHVVVIAFEKQCRNYEFEAKGRQMLATLVRVPELDGVFLELEPSCTKLSWRMPWQTSERYSPNSALLLRTSRRRRTQGRLLLSECDPGRVKLSSVRRSEAISGGAGLDDRAVESEPDRRLPRRGEARSPAASYS